MTVLRILLSLSLSLSLSVCLSICLSAYLFFPFYLLVIDSSKESRFENSKKKKKIKSNQSNLRYFFKKNFHEMEGGRKHSMAGISRAIFRFFAAISLLLLIVAGFCLSEDSGGAGAGEPAKVVEETAQDEGSGQVVVAERRLAKGLWCLEQALSIRKMKGGGRRDDHWRERCRRGVCRHGSHH